MSMHRKELVEALTVLGEVLQERGEAYDLAIIGGGALLLLGLIERPTKDLDIVARIEGDSWTEADPLPEPLLSAIVEVAGALDLPDNWLNAGPTLLMRFGLEEGFSARAEVRTFGSLTIRIAGRRDQVALKLYAAVDQGPRSRHFADLQRLGPGEDELLAAALWCRSHDPSAGFLEMLLQALAALGVQVDHV